MDLPDILLPHLDLISSLARPAATFEPIVGAQIIDPKASRMGGTPFTPIYTDWPSSMITEGMVSRKRPQAFIGQFNFREIVTAVPELVGHVPSQGLFQLFYDMEYFPYTEDHNYFSTLWFPDIEELSHRPMEQGIESYPEREFGLKFSYRPSRPELDGLPGELEMSEAEIEAYEDWGGSSVHHQIAGFPFSIQNSVLEEFEGLTGEARPWKMLIQIDYDEKMNIDWGDAGTLYLAVQTDDLATADLSQAQLLIQFC